MPAMSLLPPGVNEQFPPDREGLTPLFKQYLAIKDEHPDTLLLYRLGDFYEMFGPDAVRAAQLLGLTLTSRSCGQDYKVAMAGVPHHSSVRYIKRLVEAGEAAAICEQTEDPSQAKGLVERAVTRIITAGTLVEDEYLAAESCNFLAVAARSGNSWGIALLESSGGQVELYPVSAPGGPDAPETIRALLDSALRHYPAELLIPEGLRRDGTASEMLSGISGPAVQTYAKLPPASEVKYFLERYFSTSSLGSFGIGDEPALQAALFALVRYLKETFKAGELNLSPRLVPQEGYLQLDSRAAAHLELAASLDSSGGRSLYDVVGRCRTAHGRRALRRALQSPLADADAISRRHASVELLYTDKPLRLKLAALLDQVQDVERIANRITLGRTHPKEVCALVSSLEPLGQLAQHMLDCGDPLLGELAGHITPVDGLHGDWHPLLADDPPVKLSDGGTIRPGADSEVDRLRGLHTGSREWFAQFEQRERERTGIKSLKVKQTGAFGYFIEVSKANLALVPEDYVRRQTLVNNERFTTEELKAREQDMQFAEQRLLAREGELFGQLCQDIAARAGELATAARAAALMDMLQSLAEVAKTRRWVRPQLLSGGAVQRLEIDGGRHPLVEDAVGERYYTPNDCYLDTEAQQILLLTGPNMGGKSTYLRMAATVAILCQIGGFVPAKSAKLPVFDRIYTRIGAQDYLARGQSTFMVEMVETAEILNTCGPRSLIILDEVGRGTSTYDGISIAKAVLEYLHEHKARPLTLFATHFFELTDLAHVLGRVKNFQVEVKRDAGRFVFLYRVSPGAASDSFGVEVAALAGLPEKVVQRARDILGELEDVQAEARSRARRTIQLGLFGGD